MKHARPGWHRPNRHPYFCSIHRIGFNRRGEFDYHLTRRHWIPWWRIPHVVFHTGFGWTFGH